MTTKDKILHIKQLKQFQERLNYEESLQKIRKDNFEQRDYVKDREKEIFRTSTGSTLPNNNRRSSYINNEIKTITIEEDYT